ncbi:MAG: EthD family reductase [Bacteroidia bacterium]|nr:EthD family reductase [Bacteroidia bacterium]
MIKVSVLYPAQEGATFNMNYYTDTHAPLVVRLLGSQP